MTVTPKVTVVVPNFNRAHYLKETLISLLKQEYYNWEALIVDDGSTDTSRDLVLDISKRDGRIKLIRRSGNIKGAPVCRNIGIREAKGEFIVFLDSDDLLAPHCLVHRLEVMENNPGLDFAVFNMEFFKETPGDDDRIWNIDNGEDILERFLKLDTVWQTTGPIWRRTALERIGGFNPNLRCWQDIDIHLKALLEGLNFKLFLDNPADSYYRKNSAHSISQQNTNSLEKLKSKAELYFWLIQQLKDRSGLAKPMILSILISALNGGQFKFFKNLYEEVYQKLNRNERSLLNKIALIRVMRLDKMPIFKNYKIKMISKVANSNSIGVYSIQAA